MGLPHSLKTGGDRLIEDNLGRYCPKTFEMAKGKKERWHLWESNPGPLLQRQLTTEDCPLVFLNTLHRLNFIRTACISIH